MTKTYKNSFMDHTRGLGPDSLPEQCRTCYGFSNWDAEWQHALKGNVYEDRDCANCTVRTGNNISHIKE